ncbi:substrate-binding periplasmic protein [Duganella radicis]|uniref:Transporter substrate-binding domain-containing protein n=1 Tax=Duganella radicis TaxID=551988 RepID=A0A6L6PKJ2_9BURK|nr:ABC transporter substrate-binding protein [Duganella radicis]MTV39494.1 transporter substrate-binding domain-containing protein [Duganella radicis]
MGWKTWAVALLLATSVAPRPAAARGPLRILGSDAVPLFFVRDGVTTGFCAEIVKEIQRRIGDRTPIEVVPWVRAYRTAMAGENVMLACPKRTPAREALFKWVGPVMETHTYLYALRSTGLRLQTLDDARKLDGILLPRAFYSYEYLERAGFTNLEPVGTSRTMLTMLLAGRRQAMVTDSEQLPALLAQAKVAPGTVVPVLSLMSTQSYLTFPPDTPEAQLAPWRHALDSMKQDGTFARLTRQWLHR